MADGTLKVGTITTSSGSGTITLGQSGETITIPSGVSQSGLGITEADMWVTNADQTLSASTATLVSGNWQRFTAVTDKIGTGMSESSGVWTFPSTGIWLINAKSDMYSDGGAIDFGNMSIYTTTDNSSYTERTNSFNSTSTSGHYLSTNQFITFDVTSTSTHKIKLYAYSRDVTGYLRGNSSKAETSVYFLRLGDT